MEIRRLAPPFLAALATLALSAPAAFACPQSCIWTPNGGDYCTTAAKLDTVLAVDPGGLCYGSHDQSSFDITHGTLADASGSPFGGCTPRATVHDDFTLLGLPAGTPVALTARLEISATASTFFSDGTADAQITAGGASPAAVHWDIFNDFSHLGGPGPWTRGTVLSVPFVAIAGTPFAMECYVGSSLGEGCYVGISGEFTFDGLPASASIVSCNGFVEAPTPAQAASWGTGESPVPLTARAPATHSERVNCMDIASARPATAAIPCTRSDFRNTPRPMSPR